MVLLGVRWATRPSPPPSVGHAFPHLALASLPGVAPLTDARLRSGRPTLVNIFGSWCIPCRAEAPALAALRARGIAVAGIAVRDAPADVAVFLAATGTSYTAVGLDPRERLQAALGSSGVPETWLVDGGGIVRARFRGLRADDVTRIAAIVSSSARVR